MRTRLRSEGPQRGALPGTLARVFTRGADCVLMDETRQIRYQGSYDEALDLLRLLVDSGVRVEIMGSARLRRPGGWREQRWRTLETLTRRQARQRRKLGKRHQREWRRAAERDRPELEKRHQSESRNLEERDQQELLALLRVSAYPALQDLNEVFVNLVSTGSALAIAAAAKNIRQRPWGSRIAVEGEAQGHENGSPPAPQPRTSPHERDDDRGSTGR